MEWEYNEHINVMESVVLFRSYSLLGPAINIAIFGSKG
jgi:hypothetical protein